MSRAIILVGMTGSGKTYFTREFLKQANVNKNALLIFDVNNEWSDLYNQPFDDDISNFLDKAYQIKNGVILIEDATSFLGTHSREETLIKILTAKRHTKNTIILLFHSFADLPKYIYRKCTHLVIFKTPDSEKHLDVYGNEQLTAIWKEVQEQCKGHKFFSQYPPPKGAVPPSKIFSIY